MRPTEVGQGSDAGVEPGERSAWRAAAAGAQIVAALSLIVAAWLYFQYHQRGMTRTREIVVIAGGYVLAICAYNIYCGLVTLVIAVSGRRVGGGRASAMVDRLELSPPIALLHLALSGGLVWWFLEVTVFDYFQPVATVEDVTFFLGLSWGLYAAVLLGSSVSFFLRRFRTAPGASGRSARILPGLAGTTLLLLFAFPVVRAVEALNHPQLAPGLKHDADLFVGGSDGYAVYRIPAVLVLHAGTALAEGGTVREELVLALAEGRRDGSLDTGVIDVVMRRSEDGGRTWDLQEVICSKSFDGKRGKCGNPTVLFDDSTGTIWLGTVTEEPRSMGALATLLWGRNPARARVMASGDGGQTWSAPLEIGEAGTILGPGHGLQVQVGDHAGRLLIPGYDRRGSFVFYSDDHGLSWREGERLNTGNECQVVELGDGALYMATRRPWRVGRRHAPFGRLYSHSRDGGVTWTQAGEHQELAEPVCAASLARLALDLSGEPARILFANPADHFARIRLTVRASDDAAASWSTARLVYGGPSGYSDMAVHDDQSVSLLFERGRLEYSEMISYARFDAEWLAGGEESPGP